MSIFEFQKKFCRHYYIYVTGFGKACNNAIEHVFMYKLIKINISINMYTEVIFKHPYLCNRKEHGFGLIKCHWILLSKPFHLIPKTQNINF